MCVYYCFIRIHSMSLFQSEQGLTSRVHNELDFDGERLR